MDLTKVILIILVAAMLVFAEIFREQKIFKVTHYSVALPKLAKKMPEKKIVFLGDLHNKEYGKGNFELIQKIREEKPDMILVTGDMLVGKKGISFANAVALMKQLPDIAPVYYANGNHEQRMRERTHIFGDAYQRYHEELTNAGVHYLVNESMNVKWQGCDVRISGFEPPHACYDRTGRRYLNVDDLEKRLGEASKTSCQILLAHHPEYAQAYFEWGADLVLSGHLHGGIIRIPGVGGAISPQMGLFPKYAGGIYQEGKSTMVVTKGLGTHTINIRLFNPAEMVVLHINGK